MSDKDKFYNFDRALEVYRGKCVNGEWSYVSVPREHLVLQASLSAIPAKVLFGVYGNMGPGNVCAQSSRELEPNNGRMYIKKLKSLGLLVHTDSKKISLPTPLEKTSFLKIPIGWFQPDESGGYRGLNVWDMQLFVYLLSFNVDVVELSQAQYAKVANISRQAVSKRPSILWDRHRGRGFYDKGKFVSTPTTFDVLGLMKDMQTDKRVTPQNTLGTQDAVFFSESEIQ